jgi:hypothetical protein
MLTPGDLRKFLLEPVESGTDGGQPAAGDRIGDRVTVAWSYFRSGEQDAAISGLLHGLWPLFILTVCWSRNDAQTLARR